MLKDFVVVQVHTDSYSERIMAGMGDHTRLAMCAFMVGLLAFNPFGRVFTGGVPEGGDDFIGRKMLNIHVGEKNYCKTNYVTITPFPAWSILQVK